MAAGDTTTSLDWLVTSVALGGATNGGTVYADYTDVSVTSSVLIADNGSPDLAAPQNDPNCSGDNGCDYELDTVSFSAQNLSLAAGTYYLTIQNADTFYGDDIVAWDENDGPSSAAFSATVSGNPDGTVYGTITSNAEFSTDFICSSACSGSETFDVQGTTPEPGTVVMLLSGLLLMSATALHKRRNIRRLLPQAARIQPRN